MCAIAKRRRHWHCAHTGVQRKRVGRFDVIVCATTADSHSNNAPGEDDNDEDADGDGMSQDGPLKMLPLLLAGAAVLLLLAAAALAGYLCWKRRREREEMRRDLRVEYRPQGADEQVW